MGGGRHVVVVLSYRGRDDTLRCVQSLLTGPGTDETTVLVVDNGSDDGVLEDVTARWPQVATTQHRDNFGFTGGMNSGLRRALADGADVVTILNNDTVVPPGTMAALAAVATSAALAVSPEVRYTDGRGVWFGGGTVDPATGLARHLTAAELTGRPPDVDGLRTTDTLAGCCVTASARVWREVGLLDERYFLTFEDSDWSLRARAAGVRLVVDTRHHVEHVVSASFTGEYSYLGLYYYARNGLLFVRERTDGLPTRSARLLRRHVVPAVAEHLRDRRPREAARRGLVVAAALAGHLTRRYGRAPRWLERRAARWAR